jgi:hypothetical protein
MLQEPLRALSSSRSCIRWESSYARCTLGLRDGPQLGRPGGSAGIRTRDLSIKSRLLYQLSYGPTDAVSLLGAAVRVNPRGG